MRAEDDRVAVFKETIGLYRVIRDRRDLRVEDPPPLQSLDGLVTPLELAMLVEEISSDLSDAIVNHDRGWMIEVYKTLLIVMVEYRETLSALGADVELALVPMNAGVLADEMAMAEYEKLINDQPFDVVILFRGRVPDFDELPDCGTAGCRSCEARRDWLKNNRIH